jgi:hypothetical protein
MILVKRLIDNPRNNIFSNNSLHVVSHFFSYDCNSCFINPLNDTSDVNADKLHQNVKKNLVSNELTLCMIAVTSGVTFINLHFLSSGFVCSFLSP